MTGVLVHGQNLTDEINAWKQPANEARRSPERSCASLRALTGYEFSIATAEMIPGINGAPEFCRVTGLIQPEIQFEVALPSSWHGRLLMIGNGGFAGEDLNLPARQQARNQVAAAGFVFTHTNTGHEAAGEAPGAFAMNKQQLLDYAFRAVHVTVDSAKRIATAYYGHAPARSYFVGCSTGGRQALMSAQRFPNDFDGISAGAPVLDFVTSMLRAVSMVQILSKHPIPEAKIALAGKLIYESCDAQDGVKDGVIDDPRKCAFQPGRDLPKCSANDQPECFTDGQLQALTFLYSEQKAGNARIPAWPVGPEALGSTGRVGWYNWLVREGNPPLVHMFAEGFFRYFTDQKNPKLELASLDLGQPPDLEYIRRVLNATDTDLSQFRDRGGKLLMWFGWADPALNPVMGIEYYEAVAKAMGPKTTDFFRLFMMPGVFHCSSGPGCDSAPRLAALIDWVEKGRAPERMIAARNVSGKAVRTRPLCPYPQVAKYKGQGSIDEAANFSCAEAR